MTKTLQEMLAERSLDSRARIKQLAEQLLLENQLSRIREELEISQKSWLKPWVLNNLHCLL